MVAVAVGTTTERKGPPIVQIGAIIEALCAAHLSSGVVGPYQQGGGVMIVGPVGQLKTTLLDLVAEAYKGATYYTSDLNAQRLNKMRPQLAGRGKRTIIIPELAKLYKRNPNTALNVEGTLQALVTEGWVSESHKDASVPRSRARCTVLAALTEEFRDRHWDDWEGDGFARRFLWPLIRLENPSVLDEALDRWVLLDLQIGYTPPSLDQYPNYVTRGERQKLTALLESQPGPHQAQREMLAKMLAVLKWWYQKRGIDPARAFKTIQEFGKTLGREGARVMLPPLNGGRRSRLNPNPPRWAKRVARRGLLSVDQVGSIWLDG